MQDPTYPDGRRADVGHDRRITRLVAAAPPATRGPRRAPSVLVALLVAVLLAATVGCSVLSEDAEPDDDLGGFGAGQVAPSTAPESSVILPEVTLPEGFVLPDTRSVVLPPVLGRPEPEPDRSIPRLPVRGGSATLRGAVIGPDGPVAGATVRVERFVGDDFGREDIGTNAEGRWEIGTLLGGRYRVRAWARPDLASVDPQAAFLADENGAATLDIPVDRHEGEQLQGALDVAEPAAGQIVTFRALVSRVEVDEEGIVRGIGVEGREVLLGVLGGIRIIGEKQVQTDADGFATFSVVCLVAGVHGVTLRSGDLTADVELPECLDGVVDLEALPPELPEFAVGATLTVPSAGPFPPGTYAATSPGNCGTSFQEFIGDRWANNVSLGRSFSPSNPIRNLTPVPGTAACTFRRVA